MRFSRLDRVDDVHEAQSVSGIQFGKCFFASCWTYSGDESIPLWQMYTESMSGVRISLPKDMFKGRQLEPPRNWGITSIGTVISPIPFEKLITDSYFIPTISLSPDQFFGAVSYTDNVEEEYGAAVQVHKDEGRGTAGITIKNLCQLARLKKKVWAFQEECRFVLFILPSQKLPPLGMGDPAFPEQLSNFVLNALLGGKGPEIEYFDLELEPGVLDKIVVTTGPLCSEGNRVMVESLLSRFTNGGRVEQSKLTGTIRRERR